MTCDWWHMIGLKILAKFKLSSSNGLGVMIFGRIGKKGWLTEWMNESDGGVCRTALVTPGLLKIPKNIYINLFNTRNDRKLNYL